MEFAYSHVMCNWRPDGAGECLNSFKNLIVKELKEENFLFLQKKFNHFILVYMTSILISKIGRR